MKFIVAAIILILGVNTPVHANGLNGQRLEKTVDQYIIDVGTDQVGPPLAGEPMQFDFNLLHADTRDLIIFTNVVVEITKQNQTLYRGNLIAAQYGPTLITYIFPEAGMYELGVTFYDHDRKLAEGTLPSFNIKPGTLQESPAPNVVSNFKTVETNGQTVLHLSQPVDTSVADISIDQNSIPTAKSLLTFNFNLLKNNQSAPQTDVAVLIEKGDDLFLSSDLFVPHDGQATLAYAFPQKGVYQLTAVFYNGNESVTAIFPAVTIGAGRINGTGVTNMPLKQNNQNQALFHPNPSKSSSHFTLFILSGILLALIFGAGIFFFIK